jgi:hypothetical protein
MPTLNLIFGFLSPWLKLQCLSNLNNVFINFVKTDLSYTIGFK